MREQEQSHPKAGLESGNRVDRKSPVRQGRAGVRGQKVLEDWAIDEGTQKLHPNWHRDDTCADNLNSKDPAGKKIYT